MKLFPITHFEHMTEKLFDARINLGDVTAVYDDIPMEFNGVEQATTVIIMGGGYGARFYLRGTTTEEVYRLMKEY